jgi:hypothetical protein
VPPAGHKEKCLASVHIMDLIRNDKFPTWHTGLEGQHLPSRLKAGNAGVGCVALTEKLSSNEAVSLLPNKAIVQYEMSIITSQRACGPMHHMDIPL